MTPTAKQLEAQIRELSRRIDRAQDRPALVRPARQTRLAKTVKDPVGEDYPTPNGTAANTFWIVFLDGYYTEDLDTELTPTYDVRQEIDDAQTTAHNVLGHWQEEGTILEVHFQPGIGQPGQWWFSAEPTERDFELKDDIDPGDTVTAYLRVEEVTDTDEEFEVTDKLEVYRGRAQDKYSGPDDRGSLGRAVLLNGVWEIREMEPHALILRAQINMAGDLGSGDANITVDNVTIVQPTGAIIVDAASLPITSLPNTFSQSASDDDMVDAIWNQDTEVWDALPICP